MMPVFQAAGCLEPTSAAIRQLLIRNYRLRLFFFQVFDAVPGCEWLPQFQNPRRNQYNPEYQRLYWFNSIYMIYHLGESVKEYALAT